MLNLEGLNTYANLIQIASYQELLDQANNDDIMTELQHQNKVFLEQILNNQKTIIELIAVAMKGIKMYDIQKANEIYKRKLSENPNFYKELVEEWREDMPENFTEYMLKLEYGCHIVDEDMYDEAVSLLKWVDNKGEGAKWSVEEIKKASDIDFNDKPYYPHDFAYVVNMLWSDYCNIFTDVNYYLRMAKNYLEDEDYAGEADERAYKNARKRIRYFTE